MAAEDEEYSYIPNDAVMGAVQTSVAPRGLTTGGVQGASGLGPARPDSPRPAASYLSSLRPKDRARAEVALANNQQTAAHNSAMEAVARAKYALDASNSFYNNAKTRNELIQQANQLNQSASFFAEHANLNPYAPDYFQHVNALAAKYPGATENKTVQAILANPKLREQAALKGDVPGEVATRNALKNGWLKAEDLVNPQLRNQDGSFNHEAASELATLREGASVEPPHVKTARVGLGEISKLGTDLTPEQESLKNIYTNTVLQFEKGRQATLGIPQPQKISAGSFLPRSRPAAPVAPAAAPAAAPVAAAPAPAAPAPQVSIPKAPPPPTPAPKPISPEQASKALRDYFGPNQ